MLANERKSRVAMVDLDLFFGNCGLALDLQPGHGFREALENPSRIDGLFIERAMVRESDNLLVLTGEEALDYVITFDPSSVEVLLDHLRRDFPYVVVDIPRFAARSQLSMLAAPASVVVVSDPSLVGMRDTQRLVKLFKKNAPQAEIVVTLSRVGANKSAELSKADFEKSAEVKVDQIIPCDLKALALSAGSGKALAKAAPKAPVTTAVRELSSRFHADAKTLASKTGWKKWVRGRG
jgi:pilus assembly protein CpaE